MYKFDLSVSTTESRTKKEINFNALTFEQKNITIEEFINLIKLGHTFCYCFNQSNFHIRYKKLENFKYTNVIAFDIDDSAVAMNDYVSNLKFKPSVIYTSYSNGEKGYRYRLIYLFNDRITDSNEYKSVYNAILNSNNIGLKDNCMSSVNQCFIGNGKSNVEVINNNIVYNISDFSDYITTGPKLINKIYKTNNNTTVINLMINSGLSVEDYVSMSFESYYNKYKDTYRQFCSSDLEYNEEGYALIDENYISIQRLFQWITEENGKKYCIKIKWKDGEKRFKKLFCSAILRRKIKNDITFDELLFNTAIELETYYFNDDNRFSKKDVLRIVEKVMSLPIDKVNSIEHYKDKRRFALDPVKFNGRNEKSAARQRINKKLNYEEISKYYNPELKDKENLEILKANGVKVSSATLTRFKKEMGIKKLSKFDEIGSMYDPTLSDKENIAEMKRFGLEVKEEDLRRWRYKYKVKKCPVIASNESNDNIYQEAQEKPLETITEDKETDDLINDLSNRLREEEKENLFDIDMYDVFKPLQMHLINHSDMKVKEYGFKRMENMIKNINNKSMLFESQLEIIYNSTQKYLYNNIAI